MYDVYLKYLMFKMHPASSMLKLKTGNHRCRSGWLMYEVNCLGDNLTDRKAELLCQEL